MLYLVATPIGNLGDISQRALDTLRAVDLVASEDTRHTGQLLRHFDIRKPQVSFFEHNEARALPRIMAMLADGRDVALVTDAGTPGISDPGFTLVRAAIAAGHPVTMIPGPAAVIMAVVLSGLPAHSFTFRGFPPRKAGPRRRFLAVDHASPHTLVFYESPYRLLAFLADALDVYGDRPAAISNDLTKLFEVTERGLLSELIARLGAAKLRGEYTVVIGAADTVVIGAADTVVIGAADTVVFGAADTVVIGAADTVVIGAADRATAAGEAPDEPERPDDAEGNDDADARDHAGTPNEP